MIQKRLSQRNDKQKGVSAIFIVIFAALLLSLISISFIGLMVSEQGRSIDDEQSQGAYDAALAGIEDGKRALIECERGGNPQACTAVAAKECNTVQKANIGIASGVSEVEVNSGATDLNMAYTCVVVSRETPDYLGRVSSGTRGGGDAQLVIPLRTGGASITSVVVRWFSENDVDGPISLPTGILLPAFADWPISQPPIMRTQLIQYNEGDMSDVDFDEGANASTLYLMPSGDVASTTAVSFGFDARRTGSATPSRITCADPGIGGYACEAKLELPTLTGTRVAYLRLSSFYNNADVQVVMKNSLDATVPFSDVQPSIDATGRANDLFRRIETRVEFGSEFPYPRAAVDITDDFCKTFSVGRNPSDFDSGGCTP